jgi:AcrR family transcriptional regulator
MPRPADRRAKIELLRAAEAVFAEHGLAAAKVLDITARAGVSKGAFYLHFESKDDCWRQIIEGFVAKLAERVEPPRDLSDLTLKSAVELLFRWHEHDVEILEFCWVNRALLKMVFAGGGGAPYAYLIDEFGARVAENMQRWLRHAVAVGLYRSGLDPEVTATLISGAYHRLVHRLIHQPRRPDLSRWCWQAIDLFTRGLLAEEARAIVDREVTIQAERRERVPPPCE